MRSPLIQSLIDVHHYKIVTQENADAFLQSHENVVLFFTENPKHFPESNDVAVILPELVKQFSDRLTAAVVDEASERSLHRRFAFTAWPALVFLRRGEYLGVITGMQDWQVFQHEFEHLLNAPVSRAPAFSIPIQSESGGCA